MRKFEKITKEQFYKDIEENDVLYSSYNTPKRSTKHSAGYDFEAIQSFTIKPGEIKKIPTGIKVTMGEDEMLMLFVRSSMGFKYNIRLCNQVGIIESDYYNNESNEGHMWIALQNEGTKDYVVEKGNKICQGVFSKFLIADDEEEITNTRNGGFGSTNK